MAFTLPRLRHSHAAQLIEGDVSLRTVRSRLNHRHTQTMLRHTQGGDTLAGGTPNLTLETALQSSGQVLVLESQLTSTLPDQAGEAGATPC